MIEINRQTDLEAEVRQNSRNIEVLMIKIDAKLEELVKDYNRSNIELIKIRDDVHEIELRLVETETMLEVLKSHEIPPRVAKLEEKWSKIYGAIAASGVIGGVAAALVGWAISLLG